jgi:hypothetical protein
MLIKYQSNTGQTLMKRLSDTIVVLMQIENKMNPNKKGGKLGRGWVGLGWGVSL